MGVMGVIEEGGEGVKDGWRGKGGGGTRERGRRVLYWLFQFAALLIHGTVFSGPTISIVRGWLLTLIMCGFKIT